MAFRRVYDLEQADKLWEAGLLWNRRAGENEVWVPDDSYTWGDEGYKPSQDMEREGHQYEYAILLED